MPMFEFVFRFGTLILIVEVLFSGHSVFHDIHLYVFIPRYNYSLHKMVSVSGNIPCTCAYEQQVLGVGLSDEHEFSPLTIHHYSTS